MNMYSIISEILITRASLSCFITEYRCYKSRDNSIWQLARYVLWVNLVFKLISSGFESQSPIQHTCMLTGCYNYSLIQLLGFYGFCGAFGDRLAMHLIHISQLLSKPRFQPRCLMNLWLIPCWRFNIPYFFCHRYLRCGACEWLPLWMEC